MQKLIFKHAQWTLNIQEMPLRHFSDNDSAVGLLLLRKHLCEEAFTLAASSALSLFAAVTSFKGSVTVNSIQHLVMKQHNNQSKQLCTSQYVMQWD